MDNRIAAPRSVPPGSEPAPADSPRRPTDADIPLLQFAQTLELAARDLYDVALGTEALQGDEGQIFLAVRENHEEYASAMSPLLGTAAPQHRDDATFDQLESVFAADDLVALAEAAYHLESTLVSTYLDLLGRFEGTDSGATVTAILLVESRHCAVFASMAGHGDDLDAMLVNDVPPLPVSGTPSDSSPATATSEA